jgi:LEA14-like dessication related protein
MVETRRVLKLAGVAVGGLVLLIVAAYLLGFLGVPSVTGVENQFGPVNQTDTVVETDLGVSNPNPIGISLGGTDVNYTVFMNEVAMATGYHGGIGIGSGNSTLNFTTYLKNERIPEWWYTHVNNGEVTDLVVDADISVGLLFGQTFDFQQPQTVETDIIGSFNSTETKPINLEAPIISDPALYLNETRGTYGENLTRDGTPIETAFTVYNPKSFPYAVSEIGYTITMNNVTVGNGSTEDPYSIPPRSRETLTATTVIQNERLDDWWVSHLERNQVTDLTIDFYIVIDPKTSGALGEAVPPIRYDADEFDYHTTIETDMFGTKPADGASSGGESTDGTGSDGGDGSDGTDGSDGADETTTTTAGDGSDGGILDGGDGNDGGDGSTTTTAAPTATQTETSTSTPTASPTEDDGGILNLN